jgi:hypothetical protein
LPNYCLNIDLSDLLKASFNCLKNTLGKAFLHDKLTALVVGFGFIVSPLFKFISENSQIRVATLDVVRYFSLLFVVLNLTQS